MTPQVTRGPVTVNTRRPSLGEARRLIVQEPWKVKDLMDKNGTLEGRNPFVEADRGLVRGAGRGAVSELERKVRGALFIEVCSG
jgi:hypothetical protein